MRNREHEGDDDSSSQKQLQILGAFCKTHHFKQSIKKPDFRLNSEEVLKSRNQSQSVNFLNFKTRVSSLWKIAKKLGCVHLILRDYAEIIKEMMVTSREQNRVVNLFIIFLLL